MKIRTPEVPADHLHYLTVNREYEVTSYCPAGVKSGDIIDDEGDTIFVIFEGCGHSSGTWEVVHENTN